jgi:hypothetical protein
MLKSMGSVVVIVMAVLCGVPGAHARLVANALAPDKVAAQAGAASRLALSRLGAEQVGPSEYVADSEALQEMLESEDGLEVLAFIVSCALPGDVTLLATGADGTDYTFYGDLGLASEWLDHPLRESGQGWVSACLFARLNAAGLPTALSLRGQHPMLTTTPQEEAVFTLEEGAYYGNYFAPASGMAAWIACRGEDQAFGEYGSLLLRDCAEPDPSNPTQTECGLSWAGDCGDFAPEQACRYFTPQSCYSQCLAHPIGTSESKPFREVITVFLSGS